MSDIFWSTFPATIIAFGTFIGILVTNWLAIKAARKVEEAAQKVETVREVLIEAGDTSLAHHAENKRALAGLQKVAVETHVLVNSKMATALRLTARALRRVAEMSGKPEDEREAIIAEEMYEEHMSKQKIVDEGHLK